jgi:hypothetical protein
MNGEISALSFEVAQLVVGAAALDSEYRRLLLNNRSRALTELSFRPGVPNGCRLSDRDHALLSAIPARTFAEFARGVEQLCLQQTAEPPYAQAG